MKLAPIARELKKHSSSFTHIIVHTGQHYDHKLSSVFFKDLGLPEPDIYLGAGSGSHAEQTSAIMIGFEKVVKQEKPDLVIVFGDVNSTIACALVCAKLQGNSSLSPVPLAHIESGLRSFDNAMPEEINRIVTDSLSEFLFVTERTGVDNLVKEGINKKKIFLVGDTMIDSLVYHKKKIAASDILKRLKLKPNKFILATIHRPVNVDTKKNLSRIISIFRKVSATALKKDPEISIVLPIHPRTLKMAGSFGLLGELRKVRNLITIEPAGYIDFIRLLGDSLFVMTDSGGIQEEATFLKIPCLTLRDSFERNETLELGTNTLCRLDEKLILKKTSEIIEGKYKKGKIPRLMDAKASQRIVNIIKTRL